MKKIQKRILEIAVSALMISVFTVGCDKKDDNSRKNLLIGAAALNASRSTGAASTYTIGGTVSDLWTSGLVLQNNAGDDVTVTAASGTTSGTFTFATKVSGTYAVTVKTQPSFATCTVSSGSGTASANVSNVSVSCATSIGGGILKALTNLTGAVTVFAGPANGTSTPGNTDAIGASARFSGLEDITSDGKNLYAVESGGNNRIRKIVISTADVSTLAGSTSGNADGTGTAAQFNAPTGITTDGTNLYVSDTGNNRIRKIVISSGVVTTLAGSTVGSADGTGTAAQFNAPRGLTTDGTNLYVADYGNNRIRKIVISSGVVTTLAGNTSGNTDGTGTAALFNSPVNLITDGTNLFVVDYGNFRVRKIVISTGVVTTLAGSTGGDVDGSGTSAKFSSPQGITSDGTSLYVVENGSNKIRKIQ